MDNGLLGVVKTLLRFGEAIMDCGIVGPQPQAGSESAPHVLEVDITLNELAANRDTALGQLRAFGILRRKFREIKTSPGKLPGGCDIGGVILEMRLGLFEIFFSAFPGRL